MQTQNGSQYNKTLQYSKHDEIFLLVMLLLYLAGNSFRLSCS